MTYSKYFEIHLRKNQTTLGYNFVRIWSLKKFLNKTQSGQCFLPFSYKIGEGDMRQKKFRKMGKMELLLYYPELGIRSGPVSRLVV